MIYFIKYKTFFCFIFLATGIYLQKNLELGYPVIAVITLLSIFPLILKIKNSWALIFLPLGLLICPSYKPSEGLIEYLNKKVIMEGTVLDMQLREKNTRMIVKAKRIYHKEKIVSVNDKILIYSKKHPENIYNGTRIKIQNIKLNPIKNFKNPGAFDLKSHYSLKGIFFSGFVNTKKQIVPLGRDPNYSTFLFQINKLRKEFANLIRKNITYPESEIIAALTIGMRSAIPQTLRERFTALGISHILAISGLHIGIIAYIFYSTFKWLLKRSEYVLLKFSVHKISALLTIAPVFLYTAVTGFATSSVRAFIMITIYLLSILCGKEEQKINSLGFAGIIILFVNPFSLFELSFILSFTAVFSILVSGNIYPFKSTTLSDKTLSAIKATTAATIGTFPMVVNSFGYLPILSIPTNLLIVPFIELFIIPLGLVSLLLYLLTEKEALFLLRIDEKLISVLLEATKLLDHKFTYLSFPKLSTVEILLYLILWMIFLKNTKKSFTRYICIIALLGLLTLNLWNPKSLLRYKDELRISCLDAGYKNVQVVELPSGKTILINGGYSLYSTSDYIEKTVITHYLLQEGITSIDYLIITSTDKSHINGAKTILKRFKVHNIWTNGEKLDGELWKLIREKRVKWKNILYEVNSFTLDKVRFEFVKPRGKFQVFDYRYPLPLVIKISYGKISFLTGELLDNSYVQKEISHLYPKWVRANILYLETINLESKTNFIPLVNPSYLICKKCLTNQIEKTKVFDIEQQGMIGIKTDGTNVSISSYLGKDI